MGKDSRATPLCLIHSIAGPSNHLEIGYWKAGSRMICSGTADQFHLTGARIEMCYEFYHPNIVLCLVLLWVARGERRLSRNKLWVMLQWEGDCLPYRRRVSLSTHCKRGSFAIASCVTFVSPPNLVHTSIRRRVNTSFCRDSKISVKASKPLVDFWPVKSKVIASSCTSYWLWRLSPIALKKN